MSEKKINSTKTINQSKVSDKELQEQINKLGAKFKDEKKVKVNIPKVLAAGIGPTLPVGVNGVVLVIPVDGKAYEIPETFANHVHAYLENLQ